LGSSGDVLQLLDSFFGDEKALKAFTATDDLPFTAILLLIGGNIVTRMILWLNDKPFWPNHYGQLCCLFTMIVLKFLVR